MSGSRAGFLAGEEAPRFVRAPVPLRVGLGSGRDSLSQRGCGTRLTGPLTALGGLVTCDRFALPSASLVAGSEAT